VKYMAIPRWELGTNHFSNGEVISHLTEATGWVVKVEGLEHRVILWAHVTSTVVPGQQRIVGLVEYNGQLIPADHIQNADGYSRAKAD
jgi:hypothetical protein